jgi:uncharacterized membrane protein YfcA
MEDLFYLFLIVGFLAQLVDGALGMAYGVVSSSVLLAFGVPPAAASASVHAAELFTTAASASSHAWHRNIDWRLFRRLAPVGIAGGVLGTYVITAVDGDTLRPVVAAYLGLMGLYILYRGIKAVPPRIEPSGNIVLPLGAAGGFMDAIGGGGWGPVVTTGLIGSGGAPRQVIGTVNTVEFFLTAAVSAAFVLAIVTGHWEESEGLTAYLWPVLGLILGGVTAAPLAGYVTRIIPARHLTIIVGILISALAVHQTWRLL